ncbi:hypothetical protein COCSUDRAFT_53398 [Coccomyxa subellipsoidea C-169]|uniref:DC-UbP/UBTD2 N-terminal domain-containing protein n=1 Tax=Coccomyxa subellipsoidea (strain C-169) TaxID=574566 RepID=I0YYW7_COCSC|nr:hypothetical protein COCSUDRAFT_53398 [Coccomyxa subellipsoidea C-169]EIE23586.1 hypothetical protein COCSUDRAFT_53398 [Coccomyxa subellipsoidea C-169]|eukprot:XP_005648130.1 hypothetical protein COCSUDRAFT_53398 [Coccomyxa subellipsoidea C-169]
MGCFCSKLFDDLPEHVGKSKKFKRPVWKSEEPCTESDLQAKREEFWDTQPHYGGDRVIWDALKAACESDLQTAKLILDSAGVVVASDDMSVCYDERGGKYELPKYVLNAPSNLTVGPKAPCAAPQVELMSSSAATSTGPAPT